MALIGELTDYAKNTGGIRDYINGQFENDGKDGEEVSIGGFTAFAQISEKFNRTAKVPTTFLEDGTHVNDHIIREPLTVSIEGNVSDLFVLPSEPVALLQEAQAQIGNITQYAPARTQVQLSRVSGLANDFTSAMDKADALISASQGATKYLGQQDKEAQTNIEAFLKKMEGLQATDKLIKISTSFKNYTDMYITSLEVTRDNQSKAISFNLEAQKVRIAQTLFTKTTAAQNAAIATNGQTDDETDKGAQEGEEVSTEESLIFSLFGGG
jgi:hypothetical protein